MYHFFRSTFFDFEAIKILGTAGYGGAELGEFLEAAGQIRENDPDSWHRVWTEQAVKAGHVARDALSRGHCAAARSAFLRSSNYTRASCYMMTEDRLGLSDPRVAPILRKAADLFRSATRLFEGPVHQLAIPYLHGAMVERSNSLSSPAICSSRLGGLGCSRAERPRSW